MINGNIDNEYLVITHLNSSIFNDHTQNIKGVQTDNISLNVTTNTEHLVNKFKVPLSVISKEVKKSCKSGTNQTTKKKQARKSTFNCDECSLTYSLQHERTLHKIKEHEGRRYQSKPSNFICDIYDCNKEFTTANLLSKHIQLLHSNSDKNKGHDGNNEYPCPECSKVFFGQDMFNEHRNLMHDDSVPKFLCQDCGKEFISERKLKEHSIVHKERTMYKCNVCAKVFLRSQTLQYHRLICKAAYLCDQCVDSFMTEEALEKHKLFHSVENFTCTKCNKVFPNQQALGNHEKRHSLRMNYTCQICKETVSTRATFQKHIKNHLESNLTCNICQEKFQSLVKYGYHKAEMHSIMRPYDCVLCSDEFCTRHELFVHLHNHIDINTSTNTYICEICKSKFSLKENYEKHKTSHTAVSVEKIFEPINENIEDDNSSLMAEDEDDPMATTDNELDIDDNNKLISIYKCDLCDKHFNYKSLLSHHKINDHEVKKFPCTIGFCDQIYFTLNELQKHKEQHEILNLKPKQNLLFKCNIEGCERSFQYESRLRKHLSSHVLNEFNCNKCERVFYSQAIYHNHLNICEFDVNTKSTDTSMDCEQFNSGPVKCKKCLQLFENFKVLQNHHRFCRDKVESNYDSDSTRGDMETNSLRSYDSLASPASILSVYVQNDYDSNLVSEL